MKVRNEGDVEVSWLDRHDEDFSELAAALLPQLYRRAYLLTTSAQQAEDLAQTALAKAYASWSRVRKADDPAAYVHGILLNAFLSERRRRSSGEIPWADPAEARTAEPAGPHGSDVTERLVLLDALRELGAIDRSVVVLRYWEDRSVEQTADLLNLSSAAVRNRSSRALARLRTALGAPNRRWRKPDEHHPRRDPAARVPRPAGRLAGAAGLRLGGGHRARVAASAPAGVRRSRSGRWPRPPSWRSASPR